jgi:hypothetical protein
VGSNFPISEKLIREETDFDPHDLSASANARHVRWEQLMAENKGKIDVAAAQRFLADHYDTFENKLVRSITILLLINYDQDEGEYHRKKVWSRRSINT